MNGETERNRSTWHNWFQNPLSLWKSPVNPSHSLYLPSIPSHPLSQPLCHFSAPIIPCTYPLSSLASLCHPLYTHCHPKSSPVIPCTCLCHPSLPLHPLLGHWLLGEVLCSLYIPFILFSCRKSWNLNHPSIKLVHEMHCTDNNNALEACNFLQSMHLQNTCIYFNSHPFPVSLSFSLSLLIAYYIILS